MSRTRRFATLALATFLLASLAPHAAAQDPATTVVVTHQNGLYTVEAHGVPLGDVLGRISKEAGFRVESPVASDASDTVDLRLVDARLERVLEKLLTKQNHLIVYARGTERIDKIILLSRATAPPAGAKPPGAQASGPAGPGGPAGPAGPGGARPGMQPGMQPGGNPQARPGMQPGNRPGMQPPPMPPPMQPPGMQSSAPPLAIDPRVAAAAATDPDAMAALRASLAASGVNPETLDAGGAQGQYLPDGSANPAWAFGVQNGAPSGALQQE